MSLNGLRALRDIQREFLAVTAVEEAALLLLRLALQYNPAQQALLLQARDDDLIIIAVSTRTPEGIEVGSSNRLAPPDVLGVNAIKRVVSDLPLTSHDLHPFQWQSLPNFCGTTGIITRLDSDKSPGLFLCLAGLPSGKGPDQTQNVLLDAVLIQYRRFLQDDMRSVMLEAIRSRCQATAALLEETVSSLAASQQISRTGSYRWDTVEGQDSWSLEVFRLLGYDPETTTASFALFLARIHPDDRERFLEAASKVSRAGQILRVEYRVRRPDGTIRYVQSLGRPVSATEYVGTVIDITERRKVQEILDRTRGELARAFRLTTMGELASSIAHEITQPLTAIVANAGAALQWLSYSPPNLERAASGLVALASDSRRAGDVISSLHALARRTDPTLRKLDLDETVLEIVTLMRGDLEFHQITIETDLSCAGRTVLGDRVHLQQVIMSLIMNALEAMEAVDAHTRKLTLSSGVLPGETVVIRVEDTGPGVGHAAIEHLFDPFYSTKPNGLGLGLPLCRSILEAHGGQISVDADGPQGCAFVIKLPCLPAELTPDDRNMI
jgi:PAS domain S-box-containing protein